MPPKCEYVEVRAYKMPSKNGHQVQTYKRRKVKNCDSGSSSANPAPKTSSEPRRVYGFRPRNWGVKKK